MAQLRSASVCTQLFLRELLVRAEASQDAGALISAQTLRVCRERKPVSTFPDHALAAAKQTELERLLRPPRRRVNMPTRINQLNVRPRVWPRLTVSISHDWKAAAPFRPIKREGRNDGAPSDFQTAFEARDIRGTVMVLGEEMEGRPIVPDVICLRWLPDCRVRDNPINPSSAVSKNAFWRSQAQPRIGREPLYPQSPDRRDCRPDAKRLHRYRRSPKPGARRHAQSARATEPGSPETS